MLGLQVPKIQAAHLHEPDLPVQLWAGASDMQQPVQASIGASSSQAYPAQQQLQQLLWQVQGSSGRAAARAGSSSSLAHMLQQAPEASSSPAETGPRGHGLKPLKQWRRCLELQSIVDSLTSLALTGSA